MTPTRFAQLLRLLAKSRAEEAALLEELAHAYEEAQDASPTNTANAPRRAPVRVPHMPEPRPVSDLAARRADLALLRAGIPRGAQRK